MGRLLTYMAINIDFDDNKPHVFIKQRFMNYAFIIRKWCYGIKTFWTKMKALLKSLIVFLNFGFGPIWNYLNIFRSFYNFTKFGEIIISEIFGMNKALFKILKLDLFVNIYNVLGHTTVS